MALDNEPAQTQTAANSWFTWPGRLVNRTRHHEVVSAALTIAALTAIVRAGSVAKELTVAWRFGTSDDLDAFLIAVLVPTALISIIASSFNSSFIPAYIHASQREGVKAAQELFRRVTGWAIVLLIFLSILIVVGAPLYLPLIGSGFGLEKLHLTFRLLCLAAPILVLSGVAAVWSAALNAERQFAIPALSPLATPLFMIVLLWLAPSWRSLTLITGLAVGASVEMLLLGIALRRRGFSLRPRWPRLDPNVRRVASQFTPAMGGSILMSGTSITDQAMAAMLPSGSVAALNYGSRVVQVPIVLVATALGTALMPYFSRLAAQRDWEELHRTLHHYIKLGLLFAIPFALLIFLFSEPLIQLLFKRGAFTASDVHLVGRIQGFYALQIPSYIAGIIVVRLISAVQANRFLLWVSLINLVLNIALNYLFMRCMGVAGIALSTSLVYLFSTIFCYVVIMRRMPGGAQRANGNRDLQSL